MSTQVTYKGNAIANFTNDTKTLKTAGKYMEADVVITETIAGQGNVWQDEDGYVHLDDESGLDFQAKSVNPTESSQTVKPDAGYTALSQVTVGAISSTYVGTGIARKSSTDLTASGSTVTVPVGYYSAQATKNVAAGTATTPATTITTNPTFAIVSSTGKLTASYTGSSNITPTIGAGYITAGTAGKITTTGTSTYTLTTQAAQTIIPTETQQTIASYRWLTGTQTIAAISSNYVGTNIARKSAADLTAAGSTVTVPIGYYSSQVTKNISGGTATTPAVTITTNPTVTIASATGVVTGTYTGSSNITPTIASGWIGTGTAGKITTTGTGTLNLTVQAAQTITPGTTNQYINSYRWLTGSQTIKGDANLVASNIAEGVSIFGVTGTHTGGNPLYEYVTFNDVMQPTILASYISDLVSIPTQMFITKQFSSGSYYFNNVTSVSNYAFARYEPMPYAYYQADFYFSKLTFIPSLCFRSVQWLHSINLPVCTALRSSAFMYCASLVTIEAPNISTISPSAFYYCTNLASINFPNCSTVASYAFYSCTQLSIVNMPENTYVGSYAFEYCYRLSSIEMSKCTAIYQYGFTACSSLTTAKFINCQFMGPYIFSGCSQLTTISFTVCSDVGTGAFYSCSSLTTANFPSCITIGSNAFFGCIKLATISFPLCTTIGSMAFYGCSSLKTMSFPFCSIVEMSTFYNCAELETAIFNKCDMIKGNAFRSCYHLLSFYLLNSSIATLSATTAFTSTPISTYTTSTGGVRGSIFVPASLYNSYKTATNWSFYSSQFASLTDAQVNNVLMYGRHDP